MSHCPSLSFSNFQIGKNIPTILGFVIHLITFKTSVWIQIRYIRNLPKFGSESEPFHTVTLSPEESLRTTFSIISTE